MDYEFVFILDVCNLTNVQTLSDTMHRVLNC